MVRNFQPLIDPEEVVMPTEIEYAKAWDHASEDGTSKGAVT